MKSDKRRQPVELKMQGIFKEWYDSKISVLQTIENDDVRAIVTMALKEADDYITRCAIQKLVVNEADKIYLLGRVPIPLPFFSSKSDVEEYEHFISKLALDTFGPTVVYEYFLAKYLIRLDCPRMAPNDVVRAFF